MPESVFAPGAPAVLKEAERPFMTISNLSRRLFLERTARAASIAAAAPLVSFGMAANALDEDKAGSTVAAKAADPKLVTKVIADWVVRSRPEDIPAGVKKEATRSVVNSVGAMVGGSTDETVSLALQALRPYAGPPKASLFGCSVRLDPPRAALINGISSHVLDYDDTELNNIIHPAGVVASALFALSADHPLSGRDFLQAFVLGTEVECRLGNAIYPSHYDMGWHITATCGVFGAAAACGKVLGLTTERMVWALGIAATQAGGLKVMFGSMCKSFQVGRAAESGLVSALLAAQGFTSSNVPLEGVGGYIGAASLKHDDSWLTQGLGDHYEISRNTYKPFPCGIVLHPVLDGTIQIHNQDDPKPQDVQSIVVRANPFVLQLTGKTSPQTGLEGKFSVYHSVAIALIRGRAGMAEYTDSAVHDPQVEALRAKVHVVPDPTIRSDEAYVTVTMKSGMVFTKHVEHAIGSLDRPMSNDDLDAKFRDLAARALPQKQADQLLSMIWDIEQLPDVSAVPKAGALREA